MGTKRQTIIPKAPVGRILEEAGAIQVSDEAKAEFVSVLTEITKKIGERAVLIANHAGRKTVQEEDIKLASK